MSSRSRSLAALLAAAVLAGGCLPLVGTADNPDEEKASCGNLDGHYTPYTGPVAVGRPYVTLEQNTFTQVGGDYDPAISPDGERLIYSSTYHSKIPEIYMKKVRGATVSRLTNTDYAEIQPCFSPDGRSFAYATNRRGNWDVCVQPVSGGSSCEWVTRNIKGDQISPCFHPGGKWIAFSSFNGRSGTWEIQAKNRETQQQVKIGEGLYPKFSPDGRRIAFQRARTRSPKWFSVWVVDVDEDLNVEKQPVEVVSSPKWAAINPNWSPDGRYLVFATVHESKIAQVTGRILMGDDIWVVNVNGQDLVKLTDTQEPDSHPVWARDARGKDRVFFCSMIKGPKNIWSLKPTLPAPYDSVSGPLPGPPPRRVPPPAEPKKPEPDKPGGLQTYVMPPPPALSAGGE
ncbi:MAG: hypothetical protein ACYTGB_09685 [Planctomycetota bacterium]|jgi:Tol biopolymer transport system component